MSQVTPEAVWQAQLRDPDFADMPPAMLEVLRPFVEALPVVLADKLDEQCTFSTVMDAKVVFLRYCIENNFARKAADATPEEMLGMFDAADMYQMLLSQLEEVLETLTEVVGNVGEFLEARGVTEEEVMLSEQAGLNKEARELYQSGQLTMGQVLMTQPSLVTKNT